MMMVYYVRHAFTCPTRSDELTLSVGEGSLRTSKVKKHACEFAKRNITVYNGKIYCHSQPTVHNECWMILCQCVGSGLCFPLQFSQYVVSGCVLSMVNYINAEL